MKEKNEFFEKLFSGMIEKYSLENNFDDLNQEKGDEVDKSMVARENALFIKLHGRKEFFVKKIQYALEKIAKGTFGLCVDCGDSIEDKRLLARPTANYCIACKEEQEREEFQIPYQKRSHTLGKTFANSNKILNIPHSGNEEKIDEKVLQFNRIRLETKTM